MRAGSHWTDDRLQTLRTLWAAGATASYIGEQLGVSRNSVIGKTHRLYLSERRPPLKWREGQDDDLRKAWDTNETVSDMARRYGISEKTVVRRARRLGLKRTVQERLISRRESAQPTRHRRANGHIALPRESVQALNMQPCGIFDLRAGKCRFPIGHPGTPEFFYCGATASVIRPYCTFHHAIAHQPAKLAVIP